ncbi:MAG TPA: class II aldolase/adducin family protein [Rhizomicrobium sp.]|nr:class II aldolase/adducin family protein [Rhizomicrobium sp.]
MTAAVIKPRPIRDQVSEAEWRARVDVAACYRLMALYGMTDMIYNHITACVPDRPQEFLINPFGLHYEEITASSLYKIDLDGNVVLKPDTPYDILRAGFIIHSAVHAARPDIDCVIHSHSRAGTAVSCMEEGLLPVSQTALIFDGKLSYHDFEGAAGPEDERSRLGRDLGSNFNMILRNHGLLACGRSVAEAFVNIYELEFACRIQVDLMASGAKIIHPSEAVRQNNREIMAQYRARHGFETEWGAMLRRLDRIDPGYKN